MGDEQNIIKRMYAVNVAALNTRDIQTLATFYTPYTIQFPPNAPPLVG